MNREFLLSLCAQNPELEARRLASETIPVGAVSGERMPNKDTPIVHMIPTWRMRLYHKYGVQTIGVYMGKDTLLYPCIIFYIVNYFIVIYYYCVWQIQLSLLAVSKYNHTLVDS